MLLTVRQTCACGLYVCLYVCMSVYMSVCLYTCLYVCMSVYMSICLYVCMHVCMYTGDLPPLSSERFWPPNPYREGSKTGEELLMLGIWSPPILAAIWRHITAQQMVKS